MNVTHPTRENGAVPNGCPESFDAEPYAKTSQSAYDKAVADVRGQHPTMAEQLDSQGVPLLTEQRDLLLQQRNPAWIPTYERVVLDDPVEHLVADCPSCGTPIKVG